MIRKLPSWSRRALNMRAPGRRPPCRYNRRTATTPAATARPSVIWSVRPRKLVPRTAGVSSCKCIPGTPIHAGGACSPGTRLLATQPEPHSRPEISAQRWVANHFLIVAVKLVLHVHISGHPRGHSVPATQIHTCVSCHVIEAQAEEIGVGARPHK